MSEHERPVWRWLYIHSRCIFVAQPEREDLQRLCRVSCFRVNCVGTAGITQALSLRLCWRSCAADQQISFATLCPSYFFFGQVMHYFPVRFCLTAQAVWRLT